MAMRHCHLPIGTHLLYYLPEFTSPSGKLHHQLGFQQPKPGFK
jgi:hypothetical protein